MAFNLSISSNYPPLDNQCCSYTPPRFYSFVISEFMYGDDSILVQAGRTFGLDLSPLCRIVYTNADVDPQDLLEKLQDPADLCSLLMRFRDGVRAAPDVCDRLQYRWYSRPMTETELQAYGAEKGPGAVEAYLRELADEKGDDPNPWSGYFSSGELLADLTTFVNALQCLMRHGAEEVFLAAG